VNRTRQTRVGRHPIGVVTERTGLSPHVLRAWERRYRVVLPRRGDGGHRLYSDADVERLTLLHRATKSGRSVASIVTLPITALRAMVAEDAAQAIATPTDAARWCAEAMRAVAQLQPERLATTLRRALLSLGADAFLRDVVAPLMAETGDAWHSGTISVAHEHAATAVVTQVLGTLTRELEHPEAEQRVLLATPTGERHAVGAMMAAAVAAHDGWRVTWLGTDLPAAQIAKAAADGATEVVGLSIAAGTKHTAADVTMLRRELPQHVPLLLGGTGTQRVARISGVSVVHDLAGWRASLRTYASAATAHLAASGGR